jgi:predicted nuclease of predicted toxin-antitoxin system
MSPNSSTPRNFIRSRSLLEREMRFLVDADLPRSVTGLLQRYGHEAVDVRDIGLRAARDSRIAAYAQVERLCLVTGDFDFADVRNYPPGKYGGLVVLNLPRTATASFILQLLQSFLERREVVESIVGKLAIVEPGRIRLRSE